MSIGLGDNVYAESEVPVEWEDVYRGQGVNPGILEFIDRCGAFVGEVLTGKEISEKDVIQRQVKNHFDAVKGKLKKQPVIKLRDKLSFFLGVNCVCAVVFVAAAYPEFMPVTYLLLSAVLLPLRFLLYYNKGWHYFTFDFCYFVNVMTLTWLFLMPDSKWLFHGLWGLVNGPVIWAVVQWRNSLVFHSFDKITSIAIHILPAITIGAVYWHSQWGYHWAVVGYPGAQGPLGPLILSESSPSAKASRSMKGLVSAGVATMLGISIALYTGWQAFYYVLTNVVKKDKIASGTRVTSYSWITSNLAAHQDWRWRLVANKSPKVQQLWFMVGQFGFTILTLLPTPIMWGSFHVYLAVLTVCLQDCIWNGSSYYFDVFAKTYTQKLQQATASLKPVIVPLGDTYTTSTPAQCPAETGDLLRRQR